MVEQTTMADEQVQTVVARPINSCTRVVVLTSRGSISVREERMRDSIKSAQDKHRLQKKNLKSGREAPPRAEHGVVQEDDHQVRTSVQFQPVRVYDAAQVRLGQPRSHAFGKFGCEVGLQWVCHPFHGQ